MWIVIGEALIIKGQVAIYDSSARTTFNILSRPLVPGIELLKHEPGKLDRIEPLTEITLTYKGGLGPEWQVGVFPARRRPWLKFAKANVEVLALEPNLFACSQEVRPEDGLPHVCRSVTFTMGFLPCLVPVVSFFRSFGCPDHCLVRIHHYPIESLPGSKTAVLVLIYGKEDLSTGLLDCINCARFCKGKAVDGTLGVDKTLKLGRIQAIVSISIGAQEFLSPLSICQSISRKITIDTRFEGGPVHARETSGFAARVKILHGFSSSVVISEVSIGQ